MDISHRRVRPGDVVVGDWITASGMPDPHPVIMVTRGFVWVGIDRAVGGWGDALSVPYNEILTVIPAHVDDRSDSPSSLLSPDMRATISAAERNVRTGYLSQPQRDVLANLLMVASQTSLPAPLVALVHVTVRALADHTNHRQRPA